MSKIIKIYRYFRVYDFSVTFSMVFSSDQQNVMPALTETMEKPSISEVCCITSPALSENCLPHAKRQLIPTLQIVLLERICQFSNHICSIFKSVNSGSLP